MTLYTPSFYEQIRSGCQSSAAAVVPLLHELIRPERVADVGAGEGWWGHAFAELGCEVVALDGDYVEQSPLGPDAFVTADLTETLPKLGRFDVALCLEVAEHLPEVRARGFIADLCRLAPVVVFSAAIPGQGGAGHVNEQWPAYWCELFAEHRFKVSGALRQRFWDDESVEPWYRQNLLVAAKPATLKRNSALGVELRFDTPPAAVVHPTIYGWHR